MWQYHRDFSSSVRRTATFVRRSWQSVCYDIHCMSYLYYSSWYSRKFGPGSFRCSDLKKIFSQLKKLRGHEHWHLVSRRKSCLHEWQGPQLMLTSVTEVSTSSTSSSHLAAGSIYLLVVLVVLLVPAQLSRIVWTLLSMAGSLCSLSSSKQERSQMTHFKAIHHLLY